MNNLFSLEQLEDMIPQNRNVDDWYSSMCQFFPIYKINTKQRIAAFISQCSHESMEFTRLRENLNYRWESLRRVFPKYFPTDDIAKKYASLPNKQEAIANRVYANRMGNGPESSGDGWRYCGRGVIQLTGKDNYSRFSKDIGLELKDIPNYLLSYDGAIHSACWFWETNNLNRWVDNNDIDGLSDCINIGRKTQKYGDALGFAERLAHYNKFLKILS
jgi:putative chitinase